MLDQLSCSSYSVNAAEPLLGACYEVPISQSVQAHVCAVSIFWVAEDSISRKTGSQPRVLCIMCLIDRTAQVVVAEQTSDVLV